MLNRYVAWSRSGTKHRQKGLKCLYERAGLIYDPEGDYHKLFQIFRYYAGIIWQMLIVYAAYLEGEDDGVRKMLEHSGFMVMIMVSSQVAWAALFAGQERTWRLLNTREEIRTKCRLLVWEAAEAGAAEDRAWSRADLLWNYGIFYIFIGYSFLPCYLDYLIALVYPTAPSLRVDIPLQKLLDSLGERNWANFVFSNVIILFDSFTIIAHVGLETSFIFTIMDARNEMKFIKRKLEILKERASSSLVGEGKENWPDTEELTRNIVEHHQLLEKYLESIKGTYGFPMATQRFTFSLCFCFLVFSITTANKPPSQLTQDACCMCYLGLILYALCSLGESLATEMEKLRVTVYDLPWWERGACASFRRAVYMMLGQTARKPYISYKNLSTLNLEAFQDTMKGSYSLYMMLKTLNE